MVPALPTLPAGDAAFDALSDYFVAAITAAGTDLDMLRLAIARSIRGFNAAMNANGQTPGDRAGDFYWVDGVGIAESTRLVPIERVRDTLGAEVAEAVVRLWDEVQVTSLGS